MDLHDDAARDVLIEGDALGAERVGVDVARWPLVEHNACDVHHFDGGGIMLCKPTATTDNGEMVA